MRMRTDESPPNPHDRVNEPAPGAGDEVRNIKTTTTDRAGDSDTLDDWAIGPDINTHGSER